MSSGRPPRSDEEPRGAGVVSEWATTQELSDSALPCGVTQELSAGEASTHARFLERDFRGVGGRCTSKWLAWRSVDGDAIIKPQAPPHELDGPRQPVFPVVVFFQVGHVLGSTINCFRWSEAALEVGAPSSGPRLRMTLRTFIIPS
jgi:hypothetical protein